MEIDGFKLRVAGREIQEMLQAKSDEILTEIAEAEKRNTRLKNLQEEMGENDRDFTCLPSDVDDLRRELRTFQFRLQHLVVDADYLMTPGDLASVTELHYY